MPYPPKQGGAEIGSEIPISAAQVTGNHAVAQYPLGTVFKERWTGHKYVYVQYEAGTGSVASAAGAVAYWYAPATSGFTKVTCDVSDSDQNLVAGVMQAAVADGYYGFLQVWGYYATVKTNGDDDIAGGETIIGVGDGTCDSVGAGTAPTNAVLGVATGADDDANDTAPVLITVGHGL